MSSEENDFKKTQELFQKALSQQVEIDAERLAEMNKIKDKGSCPDEDHKIYYEIKMHLTKEQVIRVLTALEPPKDQKK